MSDIHCAKCFVVVIIDCVGQRERAMVGADVQIADAVALARRAGGWAVLLVCCRRR
jgi:hypothetical protein